MTRRRRTRGLTLIEVLIAVTLLSLLTLGMLMVMRVGLMAYTKTDEKLMDNRRVVGAQRVLQSELMGLIPATPPCLGLGAGSQLHFNFLQAEPQRLRLVSAFSLQEGWRGHPQILEFSIIPGSDNKGLRLIVNEIPYSPMVAGQACAGTAEAADLGVSVPIFGPITAKPQSFVLADNLASCSFSYYTGTGAADDPPIWRPNATGRGWPRAIRITMAPLEPDPSRLQPITVTAPLYIYRSLSVSYEDK